MYGIIVTDNLDWIFFLIKVMVWLKVCRVAEGECWYYSVSHSLSLCLCTKKLCKHFVLLKTFLERKIEDDFNLCTHKECVAFVCHWHFSNIVNLHFISIINFGKKFHLKSRKFNNFLYHQFLVGWIFKV